MADFEPKTTIYLCKNTGIDDQNQPYFTTESSKVNWYLEKMAFTFNEYSYQRSFKNPNGGGPAVRVDGGQELYRDCDCLLFVNENGRWIVCNIIYVAFINPNCTEIGFHINIFQTYIQDITWCDCWIEREMQTDDWSGMVPSFNNLLPEGLDPGPMKHVPSNANYAVDAMTCIVMSAYDEEGEFTANVKNDCGIYTGLNALVMNSPTDLGNLLSLYAEKGRINGIAAVFMVPAELATFPQAAWQGPQKTLNVNFNTQLGFQPKNAKLFTSEFFKLEISNRIGSKSTLGLEYFTNASSGTYQMGIRGAFLSGAGAIIYYPVGYMGMNTAYDYGVMLPIDIQCSWVGDAFANWLANNNASLTLSTVKDVLNAGSGIASMFAGPSNNGERNDSPQETASNVGNILRGAQSALSAFNTAVRIMDRSVDPAMVGGQTAGAPLYVALGGFGFKADYVQPFTEQAKTIDEFFTRFGYRTNKLKKPNVNTRPYWNYVKTAGAIIKGNIPYSFKVEMQNILNDGVTFWHVTAGAVIGDYTKDNRG